MIYSLGRMLWRVNLRAMFAVHAAIEIRGLVSGAENTAEHHVGDRNQVAAHARIEHHGLDAPRECHRCPGSASVGALTYGPADFIDDVGILRIHGELGN